LNSELKRIWNVFQSDNVIIRPMKKGVTKRIAAAAEAFLPGGSNGKFTASLYVRPESAGKDSFFLVAMHELQHIYDYHQLWRDKSAITQAEMERRGFRIMGRIASETVEKESFFRLPKLWDKDWSNLSLKEVEKQRERNITSYMAKSRFYKHLIANPNKFMIGYERTNSTVHSPNPDKIKRTKSGRLPYLVSVRNPKFEAPQKVEELPFVVQKAIDPTNSQQLLETALKNEKNLYYGMDSFVYDQSLNLQCWKKDNVIASLINSMQIARTSRGQSLKNGESTIFSDEKRMPKCIVDLSSIKTDATETFWSAPYLADMKVKFDYFSELDGKKVARFTVHKPSAAEFEKIAVKYPFVKPFRVFYGTIFVSTEDAQIIKFWGGSYPESKTTGQNSSEVLASYNATAVRQKLTSGIWVTTKIDTVAVANRKGKMRPFSYVVNYENYRQTETDMMILDDDEVVETE
jgi:hypothetical protein